MLDWLVAVVRLALFGRLAALGALRERRAQFRIGCLARQQRRAGVQFLRHFFVGIQVDQAHVAELAWRPTLRCNAIAVLRMLARSASTTP